MFKDNVKIALSALRRARGRSLLTMLGIIVGVAAVVTMVSLGEGLKQQVKRQVAQLGNGLITIRPGQVVQRDKQGKIVSATLLTPGGTLSQPDLSVIQQSPGIKVAAPLSLFPGNAQSDERMLNNTSVIATGAGLPEVLDQTLAYGGFFSDTENDKSVAIIGKTLAQNLFGENVPIGRSLRLRGQSFLVRGIFDQFPTNPFIPTVDFNKAIFIPYGAAQNVLGTMPPISHIIAKPVDVKQVDEVAASLTLNLLNAHAGQADFTVLKQSEVAASTNATIDVITEVIVGIAATSLIMGGVGIMNIMLLAVTERTREIGIRKAIGGTNRQILSQFLVEASALSVAGGLVGIVLALLVTFLIRVFSPLNPAVPLWIIGLALAVAWLIGIFFGVLPAFQAARKDPIDALRYE